MGSRAPASEGPGTMDGAASLSGFAPSRSLFTHERAHTHSQRSTMQHNRTVTIQSWPKTEGCSNGVLEEDLIRGRFMKVWVGLFLSGDVSGPGNVPAGLKQ